MARFYFTYGSEGQPFHGGWTEIETSDVETACSLFRALHPNRQGDFLNCSGVYTEEQFQNSRTQMNVTGNLGAKCHEVIIHRKCKNLKFCGMDGWARPVYKDEDGKLYVDTDPRPDREPCICTKNNNEFEGEPCDPVDTDYISFVPIRVTW